MFPLAAQNEFWEPCDAPEGAYISDIAVAPDGSIYAIGSATFRSTDDGKTWSRVSYLHGEQIFSDRDGVLYAGSRYDFYRSTDHGIQWSLINDIHLGGSPFGQDDEGAVEIISTHNGSVFVMDNFHLLRLGNGAWKSLPAPPFGYPDFYSLAADSLGNVLLGTARGLFAMNETSDMGWIELRRAGMVASIAYSPAGYWFCAEKRTPADSISRICRTRHLDSTHTQWDTVYQQAPFGNYAAIGSLCVAPSGEIYAVAGSVIIRSSDNGETWRSDSVPPIHQITFVGTNNDLLATSSGAGPLRSTDSGRSWRNSYNGMRNLPINELAVASNGDLYIATLGRGIYRSADRGTTWTPAYTGDEFEDFRSICISRQGSLLAGTSTIHRSSDGGSSWRGVFNSTRSDIRLMAARSGMIYGSRRYGKMVRSGDDGQTWDTLANISPLNFDVVPRPVEDSTGALWLGERHSFYRSADNGETWETMAVSYPTTESFVSGMAVQPSGAIVVTTSEGVIRSTDNGGTWRMISKERPVGGRNSMIVCVGDVNIFVADTSRSLYLTTDNGATWQATPLPAQQWMSVNAIANDTDGYVYVATDKGLFRSRNPQTLSSTPLAGDELQGQMRIYFRDGMIIIHSNIALTGPATLSIMKVDGREVATYTLDLGARQHEAAIPVSSLTSGMYTCMLRFGTHRIHEKFMVVR